MRPYLGWVNVDTVQKTIEQSTQWRVLIPNTFSMKCHFKSRNPTLNIPRHHEAVATDTIFSDTPAVDSGVRKAQVCWKHPSPFSNVHFRNTTKIAAQVLALNCSYLVYF